MRAEKGCLGWSGCSHRWLLVTALLHSPAAMIPPGCILAKGCPSLPPTYPGNAVFLNPRVPAGKDQGLRGAPSADRRFQTDGKVPFCNNKRNGINRNRTAHPVPLETRLDVRPLHTSHLTQEETMTQKGSITCLRRHSLNMIGSHGSDMSYVPCHVLFHVLCQLSPLCIYFLFESLTQRADQDMGREEPRGTLEELFRPMVHVMGNLT